jgi:hypothetical protein
MHKNIIIIKSTAFIIDPVEKKKKKNRKSSIGMCYDMTDPTTTAHLPLGSEF